MDNLDLMFAEINLITKKVRNVNVIVGIAGFWKTQAKMRGSVL